MEKLVIIILTLAIMLFAVPNQDTEKLITPIAEMSQPAETKSVEGVPIIDTEKADVREAEEPAEIKPTTQEQTVVEEAPAKTEGPKESEPEETVECVDEGNQSLVEYKSQPNGQPNPFENAPPADIVDHPVDELISEGEDRPGEGKHF